MRAVGASGVEQVNQLAELSRLGSLSIGRYLLEHRFELLTDHIPIITLLR